jgi:predicted small metal-binding protein
MAARRHARQTQAGRVNDQEDQMRAIDCPCGHHVEAADDEELFRLCREHVDADHPEMQRSDAQIRERVAADAYAVETVA